MSENKEIEFPEIIEIERGPWGEYTSEYYEPKEIQDWFKRCIEDRPRIESSYKNKYTRGMTGDETMSSFPNVPAHEKWMVWFEKWFSQFRNKVKNNE